MESAICLCYFSLPRAPLNCSKGLIANAISSSSRILFHHHHHHHASLCASQFPKLQPVSSRSSFPLANCIPNGDDSQGGRDGDGGDNDNNKNKVLRGVTGISMVLACVVGLMNFNSKMNLMFKKAYASSLFPGGEAAVESLLKTFSTPKLPKSEQTPPHLHNEPSDEEINDLKLFAVGLSKYGDPRGAVKILQKECNKNKGSPAEFNLKLALVELLIIQGKFEEARKRLDQHIDEFILLYKDEATDPKMSKIKKSKIEKLLSINDNCRETNRFAVSQIAQMILYKVIIHTMLENKEAAKWMDSFGKILEENE